MAAQRKITIKTPLDAEKLLIRAATVTEHLGRPFEMEVELLSPDESVDFNKVMGREVRVSVALDDGGARHFHGFVSHFSQGNRLGRYATYKARVVPWLWFLSQTADCKIFQAKSAADIIKEVFREHGFTDFKDSLTKTYRTREYCVQYRESDYAFVQRLMEEEGIYYYFTHSESGHKVVLADSYSGHEAVPGKSIEYLPPSDNVVREKDHIYEWLKTQELRPGKYVLTDYDFTKPRASLLTQYVQKRDIPNSEGEWFDYPGGYTVTADGDHYVRSRLESLQAQFERVNAECNVRTLGVGHLFKLEGYPRKDQNKEYLVVAATYRLDAGEYESETGLGEEDFTCVFEAMDSKEPFRAAMATRKPRVGGAQTATVVGPSGEEIHTDKYGRVRVQFHWDRLGQRDEKSSCWVRVSQIWAGKNWGWVTIPRIGQEVVVDFLEGDPDQPLIVGRVYNQDNMPPYELPGNKTQSGIKTRSSPNGSPDNFNEIRFEDKKGSEQLYIHAEKNQDIVVENDETHSVGHDRKKDIGNDETTHVKANRTETVDKEETITIHGGRTETVDKEEKITISGGRTENVSKDESITIGGARTESVAKDESITISGGRTENVSKNESITIGGDRSVNVSKGETVSIGKAQSVTVGDARTTSVSKDDSLSVGKTLKITAADAITITTGSASISMKKDGTITIKGKDITIDGSGKINVKASGDITMKGSKIKQN
jgi:type VI secretion system secreted protein VgrG